MTLDGALTKWSGGWRGPALAALIAFLAGLPGLMAMPPLDRDEARFAQATAQMLETRDFVVIRYQDQPRFKKPVGIHWLQAASVSLVSSPEAREIWAYRLPSLLGAMLAAAACAWGAAAFFGPRTGMLAGVLLGATFLLSTEAFIAKTDAVLCGATTLAAAALGRIYAARDSGGGGRLTRLLLWLGLALATIVKGPVGPLVVILAALSLAACQTPLTDPVVTQTEAAEPDPVGVAVPVSANPAEGLTENDWGGEVPQSKPAGDVNEGGLGDLD